MIDVFPISPKKVAKLRKWVQEHLRTEKNPEAIPGLRVEKAPASISFVVLAKTYKPPGLDPKKFRCPFCNHDKQFYDGRVILCSDGGIRLIGHRCAGNHVGHYEYRKANDDYEEILRRERFQELKADLFPLLKGALIELRSERNRHHQGMSEAGSLPQTIKRISEPVWKEMAAAVSAGGQGHLKVARWVQDFKAMERSKTKDDRTPYKWDDFIVHTMSGGEAISPTRYPLDYVCRAVERIDEATTMSELGGWDTLSDKEFNERFLQIAELCRTAFDFLNNAERLLRAYVAFMSPANLRGVAGWVRDEDNKLGREISFKLIPNGFRVVNETKAFSVDITKPAIIPRLNLPKIAKLKRVLDAEVKKKHLDF